MRTYTAVIERCSRTNLYVGYVPGSPGHTPKAPHWKNYKNLKDVIAMLFEDGQPELETEFVRTQTGRLG